MEYKEMNEETAESKLLREKDEEINTLKDVIAEQAKAQLRFKRDYLELTERNREVIAQKRRLLVENNDYCVKVGEIKDLLKLAQECADDTTKSQRQRNISKIKVEALQDVIDILEGNENEDIKTGTDSLKK